VFALGRDVYEQPQAHLPSSPGGTGKLDFGDIEADSKNAKKLAEIKEQWGTWQDNLNTAYDKALKYDKDTYLSASKKAQVWKRLANSFSQDNPYSTEDQLIRSKAVERMEYWKNYREPTPPETIQEEPSYVGTSIINCVHHIKHCLFPRYSQCLMCLYVKRRDGVFTVTVQLNMITTSKQ
jgi:hypothetical protein